MTSIIEKHYNIPFRSDLNGRPRIIVMSDDTKYLVTHPFYFDNEKVYGRCYTYRSLNDQYELNNETEIWVEESGTFSMEKKWNDFKAAFLLLPKTLGLESIVVIDDTKYSVIRITLEEFKPENLTGNVALIDFFTPKSPQKQNSSYVGGYIKFDEQNVFSITNVDWNPVKFSTTGAISLSPWDYRGYHGKLSKKYEKDDEFYDHDLIVHKKSNTKDRGTVYSHHKKGIFLILSTEDKA